MCGIIGYIGKKEASPILLEGLQKLEYRGYDSSGIGIISSENGGLIVRKTPGKIKNLQELIKNDHVPHSHVGIPHTRWATHGAPSRINSHPHADCSKKILVVHNGIIENYESLKASLQKKGHQFSSETDTEVIGHLIEEYFDGDIFVAVKKALTQLKGSFALGVICQDCPDRLIAARIG